MSLYTDATGQRAVDVTHECRPVTDALEGRLIPGPRIEGMEIPTYGTVREAVGEKTVAVAFDGGTVGEALAAFVDAHPAAAALYDGEAVRSSVRVTADGEHVDRPTSAPPTRW